VNIWQSYKQERDCLVHFVRLANTLVKDEKVHETITFLLLTLANIHRLKKIHRESQTTPPHLKYAATPPCNLSLIAQTLKYIVWQHNARCGGIFNNHFTANLPRNLPVKKILKKFRPKI